MSSLNQTSGRQGKETIEKAILNYPNNGILLEALRCIKSSSPRTLSFIKKIANNYDKYPENIIDAAREALILLDRKKLSLILNEIKLSELPLKSILDLHEDEKDTLAASLGCLFQSKDFILRGLTARLALRDEMDFIRCNIDILTPQFLELFCETMELLQDFSDNEILFLIEYISVVIDFQQCDFSCLIYLRDIVRCFPKDVVSVSVIDSFIYFAGNRPKNQTLLIVLQVLGLVSLSKYPLLPEETELPNWVVSFQDYVDCVTLDYFILFNYDKIELLDLILIEPGSQYTGNPVNANTHAVQALANLFGLDANREKIEYIKFALKELTEISDSSDDTNDQEANGTCDKLEPAVDARWFSEESDKQDRPKSINLRPGQAAFKDAVVNRYGEICAVCGLAIPELIEAAHIIPKNRKGIDDPANGLPLCTLHHKAFDSGLFVFEPTTTEIRCLPHGPSALQLLIRMSNLAHLPEKPDQDVLLWRWIQWNNMESITSRSTPSAAPSPK